jgi:hypothetical protein
MSDNKIHKIEGLSLGSKLPKKKINIPTLEQGFEKYIQEPVWDGYDDSTCLHKLCPECKGTGKKANGTLCIHMISCPCPKCSVYC